MADNIVPRSNEVGSIGTSLKKWFKGWFKDIFVSGDITDGVNDVAVSEIVNTTGKQTVGGIKTFSSFPVTPSSAPTTDYQVANKKYVDDNSGDPINNILIVVDEKPAGTGGGTFTSGDWRTRDLNTVRHNTISGASLASNQITLPAGTYYIHAEAPAFYCLNHKAKLRNTTDSTDTIIGQNDYNHGSYADMGNSIIMGTFTINDEKVFEIQHIAEQTRNTDGFGKSHDFSVVEVYTQVYIQKIG